MHLVPLQSDLLLETQRLAAELFPWEHEHQTALLAALRPEAHRAFFAEHGIASVRFWTPVLDNRVLGIAGLYAYAQHPRELWLAWFGLHHDARGHGAGAAMLDWIIAEAAREGRHTLRLWTTDEAEYARAVELYQRRGFTAEPWSALAGEEWHTQVLSLGLNGHTPELWARCHGGTELCGREAPQLVAA